MPRGAYDTPLISQRKLFVYTEYNTQGGEIWHRRNIHLLCPMNFRITSAAANATIYISYYLSKINWRQRPHAAPRVIWDNKQTCAPRQVLAVTLFSLSPLDVSQQHQYQSDPIDTPPFSPQLTDRKSANTHNYRVRGSLAFIRDPLLPRVLIESQYRPSFFRSKATPLYTYHRAEVRKARKREKRAACLRLNRRAWLIRALSVEGARRKGTVSREWGGVCSGRKDPLVGRQTITAAAVRRS